MSRLSTKRPSNLVKLRLIPVYRNISKGPNQNKIQ